MRLQRSALRQRSIVRRRGKQSLSQLPLRPDEAREVQSGRIAVRGLHVRWGGDPRRPYRACGVRRLHVQRADHRRGLLWYALRIRRQVPAPPAVAERVSGQRLQSLRDPRRRLRARHRRRAAALAGGPGLRAYGPTARALTGVPRPGRAVAGRTETRGGAVPLRTIQRLAAVRECHVRPEDLVLGLSAVFGRNLGTPPERDRLDGNLRPVAPGHGPVLLVERSQAFRGSGSPGACTRHQARRPLRRSPPTRGSVARGATSTVRRLRARCDAEYTALRVI